MKVYNSYKINILGNTYAGIPVFYVNQIFTEIQLLPHEFFEMTIFFGRSNNCTIMRTNEKLQKYACYYWCHEKHAKQM